MEFGHEASDKTSVVVIGAGIAGLSAAWRLQERGYAVTVLELATQPGGRMAECRAGPILYNTGARLVYPFGRDFNRLIRDLGLERSLVSVRAPAAWCTDDQGDYRLDLTPGPAAVLSSRLHYSERLRLLRYGTALLLRRRALSADDLTTAVDEDAITLAAHVGRSIGKGFLEAYVDPLFRGTRSWNPEEISAAFFVSTLAHLIGERRVLVFRGGMSQLTGHLARLVPIRTNCCVRSVRRRQSGRCEVAYDRDSGTVTLEADVVLIATEGDRVSGLLLDAEREESAFFSKVRYNSLGVVHHAVSGEVEPVVRFFRRGSRSRLSTYQQLPAAPAAGRQMAQLYCQLSPEAAAQAVAAGMRMMDELLRGTMCALCFQTSIRGPRRISHSGLRKKTACAVSGLCARSATIPRVAGRREAAGLLLRRLSVAGSRDGRCRQCGAEPSIATHYRADRRRCSGESGARL